MYRATTRVAQADVDGAISGSHYCAPALPLYAPLCSPSAPPCSLDAPSMLPLKRPCSLSRTKTAIANPKFGVYIIYIYIGSRQSGPASIASKEYGQQPHVLIQVKIPFRIGKLDGLITMLYWVRKRLAKCSNMRFWVQYFANIGSLVKCNIVSKRKFSKGKCTFRTVAEVTVGLYCNGSKGYHNLTKYFHHSSLNHRSWRFDEKATHRSGEM